MGKKYYDFLKSAIEDGLDVKECFDRIKKKEEVQYV